MDHGSKCKTIKCLEENIEESLHDRRLSKESKAGKFEFMKLEKKNTCTWIIKAALFLIAPNWK